MLTNTERKKLAKAARDVASEFAEGRGPTLEARSWCGCALAKVVEKAGIRNTAGYYGYGSGGFDRFAYKSQAVAMIVESDRNGGYDMVSDATRHETAHVDCLGNTFEHIPGAVVFPLLWLADELEAGIA